MPRGPTGARPVARGRGLPGNCVRVANFDERRRAPEAHRDTLRSRRAAAAARFKIGILAGGRRRARGKRAPRPRPVGADRRGRRGCDCARGRPATGLRARAPQRVRGRGRRTGSRVYGRALRAQRLLDCLRGRATAARTGLVRGARDQRSEARQLHGPFLRRRAGAARERGLRERRALPDAGPARRLRHVRRPTRGQRRLGAGVLQTSSGGVARRLRRRRHRVPAGLRLRPRGRRGRGRRLGADAGICGRRPDARREEAAPGLRQVCRMHKLAAYRKGLWGAAGCRGDPPARRARHSESPAPPVDPPTVSCCWRTTIDAGFDDVDVDATLDQRGLVSVFLF